jgi:hypothetical protein
MNPIELTWTASSGECSRLSQSMFLSVGTAVARVEEVYLYYKVPL